MKMISIVTPFLNGIDLLPDYEHATQGAQLVIVDNGSDEETRAALQTLPAERGVVIRNEANVGFAAANNQGYAQTTGDVIVFLNSDIAGDPSWLKLVADDVKDGALYGPGLGVQLVYGIRVPYIEGWCVAATRKTWERLQIETPHVLVAGANGIRAGHYGPWDSVHFEGPYWEDNDLCLRAMQSGISLNATQWPIQHKGGRSAGPLVKHGDTFERNRATFASRVKAEWERLRG